MTENALSSPSDPTQRRHRQRWRGRLLRGTFLASLAVVGVLVPAVVGADTASATPVGGPYMIAYGSSGQYVVDVPNHSRSWGQQLQVWAPNGGANQIWATIKTGEYLMVQTPRGQLVSDDFVKIVNEESGLCLEAAGMNPTEGAVVQQYGCDPNAHNQPNQLWTYHQDLQSANTFLINGASFSSARSANPDYSKVRLETNPSTKAIEIRDEAGRSWPTLAIEMRPADHHLVLGTGRTYNSFEFFGFIIAPAPAPAPAPVPAPSPAPQPDPGCIGISCLVDTGA
jgi:hypothetical protein